MSLESSQPSQTNAVAGGNPLEQDILANLGPLRDFINRQLQLREGYGDLKRREVLPDEILDQAVISALEQGAKPAGQAAYPWLRGLARRALDRALADAQRQDAIVYESDMGNALAPNAGADTGAVGRPQDMVSDSIDPATALSPEEDAVEDEFRGTLASVLAAMPEDEREALLLQLRDGHAAGEVARIEGVSEREAGRRIAAAERDLRERLLAIYGADDLPSTEVVVQAIERTPLTEAAIARIAARFRG